MINKLRKNKIKHPNNFSNTKSNWIESCKKNNAEQSLVDVGLYIISHIDIIKELLKDCKFHDVDKEAAIETLVAQTNFNFHTINNTILSDDDGFFNPLQPYLPNNEACKNTPDGVITKSIDSLKYHLCSVYNKNGKNKLKSCDYSEISKFNYSGEMLENISTYWQDILFNDWTFKNNCFVENTSEENKLRIIGKLRRDQFDLQYVSMVNTINSTGHKKEKKMFARVKNGKKIKLKTVTIQKEINITDVLFDFPPEYYTTYLTKKSNHGFTVNELIEFWQGAQALCDLRISEINSPQKEYISTGHMNSVYSIKLKKDTFTKLMTVYSNFPKDKVLKIMQYLSFDFLYTSNVWEKPLIELNDNIYFSSAIFCTIKPSYMIDFHIHNLFDQVNKKGFEYEEHVINKLNQIPDINIVTNRTKEEEIDLIFTLGNKMWICELKCNKEPVSSSDFYNYKNDLVFASKQLDRKASHIKKNLHKFTDLDISSFHTLVITNCFELSGITYGDSPVIDHYALLKYFNDGMIRTKAIVSNDGTETHDQITFFNSKEEMVNNFDNYTKNLPQSKIFEEYIEHEQFDITLFERCVFSYQRYHMNDKLKEVYLDITK